MKEMPDSVTTGAASVDTQRVKPDTSANLTRYEIWYQDTGRPDLWHSRSGKVIDAQTQGDFYHDVLQMVKIVFPLQMY